MLRRTNGSRLDSIISVERPHRNKQSSFSCLVFSLSRLIRVAQDLSRYLSETPCERLASGAKQRTAILRKGSKIFGRSLRRRNLSRLQIPRTSPLLPHVRLLTSCDKGSTRRSMRKLFANLRPVGPHLASLFNLQLRPDLALLLAFLPSSRRSTTGDRKLGRKSFERWSLE